MPVLGEEGYSPDDPVETPTPPKPKIGEAGYSPDEPVEGFEPSPKTVSPKQLEREEKERQKIRVARRHEDKTPEVDEPPTPITTEKVTKEEVEYIEKHPPKTLTQIRAEKRAEAEAVRAGKAGEYYALHPPRALPMRAPDIPIPPDAKVRDRTAQGTPNTYIKGKVIYFAPDSVQYKQGFRTLEEYLFAQKAGASYGPHDGSLVPDDIWIVEVKLPWGTGKSKTMMVGHRSSKKVTNRALRYALKHGKYWIPVTADLGGGKKERYFLKPKDAEELTALTGHRQFRKMVELGIIPKGSKFVETEDKKWAYLPPRSAIPSKAEKIALEKQEAEYRDLEAEYIAYTQAMDKLERGGYTTVRRGGQVEVDIAKYLRDNPEDTGTLYSAGFTGEQVTNAQNFNEDNFLIGKPEYKNGVDFVVAYFKKKGWSWVDPHTASARELKLHTQRLQEATKAHETKYKPEISLDAFVANRIADKGIELPKLKGVEMAPPEYVGAVRPEIKAYQERVRKATEEATQIYASKYGTGAIATSKAGNILGYVFVPARVIKPDLELKDITAKEWVIGAGQVALLCAPLIGASVGRLAVAGIQTAGVGAVTAMTVTEWGRLSYTERALALSIDALIMGAILKTSGLKLPRMLNLRQLAQDVRQCYVMAGAERTFVSKADKAFYDIYRGIELGDDKMIRRGAEALRQLRSKKLPYSLQKVINNGGSYISRYSENYPLLVKETKAMMGSEITSLLKADKATAEALKKTVTLWQKETTNQLRARLQATIDSADALLSHKPLATRFPSELESAIKEVKSLTTQAGREKTLGMALNRLEEALRRVTRMRKAYQARKAQPTELDATLTDIAKHLENTRAEFTTSPFSVKDLQDRIKALERYLLRLQNKKKLGIGRYVSDVEKTLDDVGDFIRRFKQKGITTGQQKQLSKLNEFLDAEKRRITGAFESKMSEARKAKMITRTLGDLEEYLADFRKTGLNEWQKSALNRVIRDVKSMRMRRVEAKFTIDDIEELLRKARKAKGKAEVESAIKEAEDIVRGKRTVVPPEDIDRVAKDIKKFLDDVKQVKPDKKTSVAVKEKVEPKTKTEIAKETKLKEEVEVQKKSKPLIEILTGRETREGLKIEEELPITLAVSRLAIPIKVKVGELPKITPLPYTYPDIIEITRIEPAPTTRTKPKEKPVPAEEPKPSPKPTTVPAPVILPTPVETPQPEPSPQPQPKPQPKPQPRPQPEPSPKPAPTPAPAPAPAPAPTPAPEPEKPPPPPPPPPFKGEVEEEKKPWTKKEIKSAVGWKQGFIYYAIKAPYSQPEDIRPFRHPPKGMTIVADKDSAYETIQKLSKGKGPEHLTVDVGMFDYIIKHPKREAGAKGALTVRKDIASQTRSQLTVKKKQSEPKYSVNRVRIKQPLRVKASKGQSNLLTSRKRGRVYHTKVGEKEVLSRRPLGNRRRRKKR